MQTFYDIYLSLIILGMQIATTYSYIHSNATFPATPSTLLNPEIMDTVWVLRGYAYRWQIIMMMDTLTLSLCVISLMTKLRNIQAINLVLN